MPVVCLLFVIQTYWKCEWNFNLFVANFYKNLISPLRFDLGICNLFRRRELLKGNKFLNAINIVFGLLTLCDHERHSSECKFILFFWYLIKTKGMSCINKRCVGVLSEWIIQQIYNHKSELNCALLLGIFLYYFYKNVFKNRGRMFQFQSGILYWNIYTLIA